MSERVFGFQPFYSSDSKILILGSFPSVKSRKAEFYYGNPQNRFWSTLSEFFGEDLPLGTENKKEFLLRHKIALWDIVTECEIVGSMDSEIKNYRVADIEKLLQKINVGLIILNGCKAYEIFCKKYAHIRAEYIKLPSTSPANTRFSKEVWFDALSRVFK